MKIAPLAHHQDVIHTLSDWFYDEWSYLNPDRTKDYVIKSISERININKIPTALVAYEDDELIGSESFYASLGWQLMEHVDYHNVPVALMTKSLV